MTTPEQIRLDRLKALSQSIGVTNAVTDKGDDELTDDEFLNKYTIGMRSAFSMPELMVGLEKTSPWLTYRKKFSLFVGAPKYGKSFIASGDALEAIRQFGSRILYCTVDEDQGDLVLRFSKYGEVRVVDDDIRFYNQSAKLSWPALERLIGNFKPDVVYFDSWDKLVGLLEGTVPESHQTTLWRNLTDRFVDIARRHNCGVCMLIHTLKSDDSRYAGSGQIEAAVDLKITLRVTGDNFRILEYVGRLAREDVQLEYMKYTDGSMRECGQVDIESEMLKLFGQKPKVSSEEVFNDAKTLHGFGKKPMENARTNLLNEGLIEKFYENRHTFYRLTDLGTDKIKGMNSNNLVQKLLNAGSTTLP